MTTIEELVELFEQCEGLFEIRLRIGQGSALRATEHTYIDDLDVQYATVELTAWNGLVQTMSMNGITVRGRRLVVSSIKLTFIALAKQSLKLGWTDECRSPGD